jgi:glycosyltransferase involved in cell wall biosynthesis
MPWVYGGADIFVMASQIESFGMVYAEALACGIPVIGTGVGGIPEIIEDNKSGFLIRPDDPIGLSKKLNLLIENAEMRRNFGEYGASQISKKYDLTLISKKLLGTC